MGFLHPPRRMGTPVLCLHLQPTAVRWRVTLVATFQVFCVGRLEGPWSFPFFWFFGCPFFSPWFSARAFLPAAFLLELAHDLFIRRFALMDGCRFLRRPPVLHRFFCHTSVVPGDAFDPCWGRPQPRFDCETPASPSTFGSETEGGYARGSLGSLTPGAELKWVPQGAPPYPSGGHVV